MSISGKALIFFICASIFSLASSQANGNDDPGHEEHESSHDATVVLMFMFFGIGVGALVMQVLSHYGDPLPYTCVVFLFGILFSLANKDSTGIFGQSVREWTNIDPHLLLFVFLPPLVFGEAMSLNYYNAKGAVSQALILAGPGVLIGATLMGVIAKYMLHYNWTWNLAMVFGSILAATDPVAVVALLKSAGASPKLTIIIVGESLLNDGTAMVMFNIFNNCLNGKTYSIGDIVSYFFAACLGAITFGAAMGYCAIRWLRRTNRPLSQVDVLVQIAITLCCAYTSFFIAENTFGISGVLACVGAGGMISWLGPPIILNHETMHHVWGMIEWALNTMIFLLAGLIIGDRVFQEVIPIDWFYCIALYVLMIVIRSFVLLVLFPLLSNYGHKCTVNEAIFMSWGGLRGALGMALALIVYRHGPADLHKETSRLFFYVGGVAALTLLINAPTSQALLRYLNLLDNDSTEKSLILAQITQKLRKQMKQVLSDLASEFQFSAAELEEVALCCSLLNEGGGDSPGVFSSLHDHSVSSGNTNGTSSRSGHDHGQGQGHAQTRRSAPKLGAEVELRELSTGKVGQENKDAETGGGARLSTFSVNLEDEEDEIASQARPSTAVDQLNKMRHMSMRRVAAGEDVAAIKLELVAIVRGIFLSMVRVHYWHEIEQGKLPRKSKAAQVLLYSVEKALDRVNAAAGAWDWRCVKAKLNFQPLLNKVLALWEDNAPSTWLYGYPSTYLNKVECNTEERAVYLLTSFIAAHEHAQHQLVTFINGEGEGGEGGVGTGGAGEEGRTSSVGRMATPEELQVIDESKDAVAAARASLSAMNIETVAAIRTKQAAAMILNTGAELVKDMEHQGLLATKDAQALLETISTDMAKIEKKRSLMYKEHGDRLRNRRKAHRGVSVAHVVQQQGATS